MGNVERRIANDAAATVPPSIQRQTSNDELTPAAQLALWSFLAHMDRARATVDPWIPWATRSTDLESATRTLQRARARGEAFGAVIGLRERRLRATFREQALVVGPVGHDLDT